MDIDYPELDPWEERKRQRIVETLSPETLTDEDVFESIAESMAAVCDVSKAHVSLMRSDRQCVVGEVGLEATTFDRENAFCNYALGKREIIIVGNATEDDRFSDHPLVLDAPHIRFYAGIPIVVDDVPIGTLCALDSVARTLNYDVRVALFDLVRQLEQYLELRYKSPKKDSKLQMATHLATLEAHMTTALQRGPCDDVETIIASAKERIETSRQLIDHLAPNEVEDVDDRLGLEETEDDPNS